MTTDPCAHRLKRWRMGLQRQPKAMPGVMRGQALNQGLMQEQSLSAKPHPGDQWLLINSLGCRTISQVNGEPLTNHGNGEAFWKSLLLSHSEKSLPS